MAVRDESPGQIGASSESALLARAQPGRLWTQELDAAVLEALYLVSVLLVITLPLFAWLLTLGAAQATAPPNAAAPLWYLVTLGAVAWLVGRLGRRRGLLFVVAASGAPLLLSYLALVRLSPDMASLLRDQTSLLGWIGAALGRLGAGPSQSPGDYALLALTCYIWGWCAYDGAHAPGIKRATQRWYWGLAIVIFASIVALAIPPSHRSLVFGDLMLVLACYMLAGLLSLTLTRIAYEQGRFDADPLFLVSHWRQFTYAGMAAVALVGLALGSAFAINPQAVNALPTSAFFAHTIGALFHALGQALSSIVDLIARWFGLHSSHVQAPPVQRTNPTQAQCVKEPTLPQCRSNKQIQLSPTSLPPFLPILIALAGSVTLCLTIVGITLVARKITSSFREGRQAEADEERESLDALRLIRQQVRSLLQRPISRRVNSEELGARRGAVRALYRDLLRATAGRHIARAPYETPHEYAMRLRSIPPFAPQTSSVLDDLDTVTEAYVEARYAEQEPSPSEVGDLHERVRRLKNLLTLRTKRRIGARVDSEL